MAQLVGRFKPAEGKISAGTVVRLKGSDVLMTVEGGSDDETAVVWFDKYDVLHRSRLKTKALEFRDDGPP